MAVAGQGAGREMRAKVEAGIPEGEERENGLENVFKEIIAENFPNLKKKTDIKE